MLGEVLSYYSTRSRGLCHSAGWCGEGARVSEGDDQLSRSAFVDEVFLSVQGEGIWVGERQVFVRFSGCGLDCRYCDSQRARRLARECVVHSDVAAVVPNPMGSGVLTGLVSGMARPDRLHSVAVTGGEPLLQHAFLSEWLPSIRRQGYRVYLETAGHLPARLKTIVGEIDYCSMDIKLPSATGLRSFLSEHRAFLDVCRTGGVPTMAKAVVNARTTDHEVAECAGMVADVWPEVPLVLQPATPTERQSGPPTPERLLGLQRVGLDRLRRVLVIPQTHRLAGLP